MPIYEFHCDACSRRVELFQRSMSAVHPARCPHCGSEALTRLISRFAVHRSASEFASRDEADYISGLEDEDPAAMAAYAGQMGGDFGGGMPDDGDFDDDGDYDGFA